MTELKQKLYLFALDGKANFNLSKLNQVKIYVNGIHNKNLIFKDLFIKINSVNSNIVKGYSFMEFLEFDTTTGGFKLGGNVVSIFVDGLKLSLYKVKNPSIISNDLKVKETLSNYCSNMRVEFSKAVINKFPFISSEEYTNKQFTFLNSKYLFCYAIENEPYLFAVVENEVVELSLEEISNENGVLVLSVMGTDPVFTLAYNVEENRIGAF